MTNKIWVTKSAELESLEAFRDFIEENCKSQGLPHDTALEIKLSVDEACANIIIHGYHGMDPGSIMLCLTFKEDEITIDITDFGRAFTPTSPPKPDAEGAVEGKELGNLGLYLIYQTMDNISYSSSEEGNVLRFIKYL